MKPLIKEADYTLSTDESETELYLTIPDLEIEDLELDHQTLRAIGYIFLYGAGSQKLLKTIAKKMEEEL